MSKPMPPQSDEFMDLLTEALRAGPGSPEWHQAVEILRKDDPDSDEYRLLCATREHLESGKEYRTVRAGPGFTRKIMDGIEKESSRRPITLPATNIIAILSAVVILTIVSLVVYFLLRSSDGAQSAIEDLNNVYFTNTTVSTTFEEETLPSEWRAIGLLPLQTQAGLRPLAVKATDDAYHGGGIVTVDSIPADQTFALEVTIHPTRASDKLIAEVFVTDQPQFSPDPATTPHELVWLIQNGHARVVLPDGRGEAQEEKPANPQSPLVLRILLNRDMAIIESGGKRIWAGNHLLGKIEPRYVGIRFIRHGGRQEPLAIQSIRIQRP